MYLKNQVLLFPAVVVFHDALLILTSRWRQTSGFSIHGLRARTQTGPGRARQAGSAPRTHIKTHSGPAAETVCDL